MQRLWFAALLASILVRFSCAQDLNSLGRNEVAGSVGKTLVSDQSVSNSGLPDSTISHGAGTSFEVNYARVFLATDWVDVAAEVPAIFNSDEDLHYFTDQIPKQYGSIFVTPAARVRFFPELGFSPWVSFGGGLGHFGASSKLLFYGSNTGSRGSTSGVLGGGVGFDAHIPKFFHRVRFRFEARDDWSAVPPINVNTGKTRQHNYYIGFGLVLRF